MLYQLWHVKEEFLKEVIFGFGRNAKFPEEFDLIALVEATNPEDVWLKSQHISKPWWQSSGVQLKASPDKVRSSACGDAVSLQSPNGPIKAFRYETIGVSEITPEDDTVNMRYMSLPERD